MMAKGGRLTSLDGLRGLAALVVLLHHSLLLRPELVEPYRDPPADNVLGVVWWFSYTPLHVLWDGSVAVMIFFVLSGFVLALPFARGRVPLWRSYYPSRILRLYVPVWAAVFLAVAVTMTIPRAPASAVSDWVSGHSSTLSIAGIARDALLVWNPGYSNSALWSLRWEVIFSLMLPVYLWVAIRWKWSLRLKIASVAAVIFISALVGPADRTYQLGMFFHLGTFAVGVLLAWEWPRLGKVLNAASTSRPAVMWAAALLALYSYWAVYSLGNYDVPTVIVATSRMLQVLGAGLLVVLSARSGWWATFMNFRLLQWLGSRSFSLYLVHEPLVVAAGNFGALINAPYALSIITVMSLSLLVAELFFRLIERPSHSASAFIAQVLKSRPLS